MIPLAFAMSDIPNRPDAADTAPDHTPLSEPSTPGRPADPVPGFEPVPDFEPETDPSEPDPTSPPQPDIPAPDIPEPDLPSPDQPEITPPSAPEISPPAPEIQPPGWGDVSEPPSETLERPERAAAVSHRPASPPAPELPKMPTSPPLQRAALALLLIAAAGMIGYVLSSTDERAGDPDVIDRSVEAAGSLRLLLRTNVPAEARQFIREEFGWRVGVPLFDAASLTGVAIAQAAPAVEVPVFLYDDDEDRNIAVFAYSYALLDQVPDRLRLTSDDYEELDEGTPIVRSTGNGDVLLWRDRDDIYVAVTDLPPDALTSGFTMDR